MTVLEGFFVSGFPPGFRERVEDRFELRQVAIEHAQRLSREGWQRVRCEERQREADGWWIERIPIKWQNS